MFGIDAQLKDWNLILKSIALRSDFFRQTPPSSQKNERRASLNENHIASSMWTVGIAKLLVFYKLLNGQDLKEGND